MKKFLFLIVETFSMFILVFFAFNIIKPIEVHSQALPEVSEYTFEVIEGGMQDMLSSGSQYYGISPYTDGIIATYQILGELYMQYYNSNLDSIALWTCDNNDVLVSPLSNYDVDYLDNLTLYDRYGHTVNDLSNCYVVNYDNGYFNGICYIDEYGDLLYLENIGLDSVNRKLGNIAFGGNLVEWEDFNNFYEYIYDCAIDNQMNVLITDQNVNFSDLSYFLWCGYSSNDYSGIARQSVYIFIPNICDFGGVTCEWGNANYQNRILYNSNSNWVFDFDNIGNATVLTDKLSSNFSGRTYDGYSYDYLKELNNRVFTDGRTDLSFEDFSIYTTPWGLFYPEYFLFGYNSPNHDDYLQLLNDNLKPFSFRPLKINDDDDIIEFPFVLPDEYIDLSDIQEFNFEPSSEPDINPNFNPDELIEPNNYPEINPLSSPIPQPSNLPNSNVNDNPNDDPTNNPSTGENVGDVGGINLPFINDLKNRFPFSIPFDIYNLISGLSVPREAPNFEWDIYLPIINYHWVVSFDLSSWNTQASIFRNCFLILFIIGLALWCYNHFFGS